MSNLDDLMRAILTLIPGAEFGDDNDGQIVIYTNLTVDENDSLVSFDSEGNDR